MTRRLRHNDPPKDLTHVQKEYVGQREKDVVTKPMKKWLADKRVALARQKK